MGAYVQGPVIIAHWTHTPVQLLKATPKYCLNLLSLLTLTILIQTKALVLLSYRYHSYAPSLEPMPSVYCLAEK
jgi:hypothetical protein